MLRNKQLSSDLRSFFLQAKIPLLSLVLILVSMAFALSLTGQSTSLQSEAATKKNKVICSVTNKYDSSLITVTNNKSANVTLWVQENLCDYAGQPVRAGYNCNVYQDRYNDTVAAGQTKTYSMTVPMCKIGQLDINTIGADGGGCYTSSGNFWSGGLAFAIKANPDGWPECLEPTATPTPTLTLTPRPDMIPSCSGLRLSNLSADTNGNGLLEAVPEQKNIRVSFTTENGGLKDFRLRQKTPTGWDNNWPRVSDGLSSDDFWNRYIAPSDAGQYEMGINVFSSDGNKVCASGGIYYSTSTSNDYTNLARVGSCVNTCRAKFEVVAQPTPTIRTPLTIQGRIYEDKDLKCASAARGGFSAQIPPADNEWMFDTQTPLFFSIDISGPNATVGGGTELKYFSLEANHPNTIDVCSSATKQEKAYCGIENSQEVGGQSYPGPECTRYGGFSFVLPKNARIYNLDGVNYYHLALKIGVADKPDGVWKITEALWANTEPSSPVTLPTVLPGIVDSKYRCDYTSMEAANRQDRTQTKCSLCLQRTAARICGPEYKAPCNTSSYKFAQTAHILVPVDGTDVRNLWVGVGKMSAGRVCTP